MQKQFLLVLLLFLGLSNNQLKSQSIIELPSESSVLPMDSVWFCEEDLNIPPQSLSRFALVDINTLLLQSQKTYWLYFRIKNPLKYSQTWILNPGSGEHISLFTKNPKEGFGQTAVSGLEETGLSLHILGHKWNDNSLEVTFLPFEEKEIYIRMRSNFDNGNIYIRPKLQTLASWQFDNSYRNTWQGLLFGCMFLLSIFSFIIYVNAWKNMYLFFSLQALFFALDYASSAGYLFFLVDTPLEDYTLRLCLSEAAAIFYTQFIRLSFETNQPQNRGWEEYSLILQIILRSLLIVFGLYLLIVEHRIADTLLLINLLDLLCFFLGLAALISIYRKRNDSLIRSFLLSFLVLLIGLLLAIFNVFPSLPVSPIQLGLVLQTFFLGLGLSKKIQENVENEKLAREKVLQLQKELNEDLEQKVAERTQALQEANNEILTQNEELFQTQEEIMAQREFIQVRNTELEEMNQQIHRSITAAKLIQEAILPEPLLIDSIFKEYFILYRPKNVVSGDFYWVHQENNINILVVADCTGHGVPGAFMTLIASVLLDRLVKIEHIFSPAILLQSLHDEIFSLLRQKNHKSNNGMDAMILVWESKNENEYLCRYAGAKLNLHYILKNEKDIHTCTAQRKSIGGLQNAEIVFSNQEFILSKDSLIYCGSDGLTDQSNVQRRKLGWLRIKEIIESSVYLPLDKQKEVIEKEVINYMQNSDQRDDILWMGFRI